MEQEEIKIAKKILVRAMRELCNCGDHLYCTRHYEEFKKIYRELEELNNKLR